MEPSQYQFHTAIQDFHNARQRGSVQEILARLTGKSNRLLSYDEVAEKLKLRGRVERGLQQIPINSIVGSVGRYTDFTRTFLPRKAGDRERWARVKAAMEDGLGLPPIEVYKVGDVYFVIDGNHRVSIARQDGSKSIQARVIEVQTDIPLTPDVQPDDLIIKAEYADFLDATRLSHIRPNVDLSVTVPGQYSKLMEQVHVTQFLLQEEKGQEVTLQDATANWYDTIYIPLAEAIRDRGVLRWFPGRTVTDLYIWISENRAALEKELGWEIRSDIAATSLILERSAQSEPGSWRKARTSARYTDQLFNDILVPLSGNEASWSSVEQALLIAKRENASLHGLHVVDTKEKIHSPNALAVQTRFNEMCASEGVNGRLVIEAGEITRKINERAAMTDLIVLKIEHPPLGGLSSFTSPFRTIVANSASPMLGVPEQASPIRRALLAYDGSDHAKEVLFVATYFAEVWKTKLLVFTAVDQSVKADIQDYVRRYLDIHEVEAEYIISEHGAMDYLKQTINERNIDILMMGSHGGSILQQVISGSAVDYMLRESKVPMFICR